MLAKSRIDTQAQVVGEFDELKVKSGNLRHYGEKTLVAQALGLIPTNDGSGGNCQTQDGCTLMADKRAPCSNTSRLA